jgi:hypothetical protein
MKKLLLAKDLAVMSGTLIVLLIMVFSDELWRNVVERLPPSPTDPM